MNSTKNLSDVTAAILAGGLGTRLREAVADRPKVLAEVGGRPFLTYLLDQLRNAGIRHTVLCTGYMGEKISETIGENYGDMRIDYSHETAPLGTGGALRPALPRIKSDTVLVMNGDSYCDIDPQDLLTWHSAKNASCTLVLVKMQDISRYGCVNFDSNCVVTSFSEKKPDKEGGWINAGIYCMSRELIAALPLNMNVSLEKDLFPTLIGKKFFAFPQEAKLIDIGTPSSYKEAETFFVNIDRFAANKNSRSDKQ